MSSVVTNVESKSKEMLCQAVVRDSERMPAGPGSTLSSENPENQLSAFNSVKIELGFAMLFGVLLWLVADSITANEGTQWLLLMGYSLLSMCWLVLRTRAVMRRFTVKNVTDSVPDCHDSYRNKGRS